MTERYLVMLADDDRAIHEVAGSYLETAGFQVLHAGGGRDALELARKEPFDLALLDIQMPDLDGFAVLGQLRDWTEAPVIFLSSLGQTNLKVKALEAGADDYVTKPFHGAELLARVKASLRKSHRYRSVRDGLSGSIEDIGLPAILQTLEMEGRQACIHLRDLSATVALDRQGLVSAKFLHFEGQDALLRVFLAQRGPFTVTFGPSSTVATGEGVALKDSLLAVLVKLDELNRNGPDVRKTRVRPIVVDDVETLRRIGLHGTEARHLSAVLAESDRDPAHTLASVMEAAERGAVRLEGEES